MARDLMQHAPELLARPVEVVRRLHPEPQFSPVAAEVAKSHCHLRGNRSRARKNVVQCLPRHPELVRRLAYREAQRGEHVLAQQLARMRRRELRGTARLDVYDRRLSAQ